MKPENMVHMANQIALYFASYPEARAVTDIADHLHKFWTPDMRRELIAYAAQGGRNLHEYLLKAIELLPK